MLIRGIFEKKVGKKPQRRKVNSMEYKSKQKTGQIRVKIKTF